jgi:hypothetical protein
MPRYAPSKAPASVKRRYFELIRQGMNGAQASQAVGVSLSCGSLWFIDAGRVSYVETRPVSPRYLSQDDWIEIADGLARGEPEVPGQGVERGLVEVRLALRREVPAGLLVLGTRRPLLRPEAGRSPTSCGSGRSRLSGTDSRWPVG